MVRLDAVSFWLCAASACIFFLGIVNFFNTIVMLGRSEFNYVANVRVLEFVQDNTYYSDCRPTSEAEGRLVHVSCPLLQLHDFASIASGGGLLQFDDKASPLGQVLGLWFGASSQIFQWQEEKTCHGRRRTTCDYYYYRAWSTNPQDSSQFYCVRNSMLARGCPGRSGVLPENSGSIPPLLQGITLPRDYAVSVGSGASCFRLNGDLFTGEPFGRRPVTLKQAAQQAPPSGVASELKVYPMGDEVFFAHEDPSVLPPSIGDIRTRFFVSDVVVNGSSYFSVVAQQEAFSGETAMLTPWETGNTGTLHSVNWGSAGRTGLDEMLDQKAQANLELKSTVQTPAVKLMFVSLQLVTWPMCFASALLCDRELLGNVACVLCCMSCLIPLFVYFLVVAVVWTLAWPAVGLALFAGAFIVLGVVASLGHERRRPARTDVATRAREVELWVLEPPPRTG